MGVSRLSCWECGLTFFGRTDARYCCAACKQRAYRRRGRDRSAQTTHSGVAAVDEARRLRREAASIQQRALEARRAAHTVAQSLRGVT
ncbi:hypothetical protein [Mycobacterium sp. SMC-4]|uniref:hypothetical protein n=1 Tax=Mycobacterium sp. SMC-4 TaxID=2857059 RepID=UPI0021B33203|nr:hypothetical protein [Mycobacterium sp. SMC-4]UXA19005.1 hypothetical protein KXD98_04865 [Mycobacterium sp. SMC-4]